MSAQKRTKTQVLTVVEVGKKRYWHSEVLGWVPMESVVMDAAKLSVGTKITIQYAKESVHAINKK